MEGGFRQVLGKPKQAWLIDHGGVRRQDAQAGCRGGLPSFLRPAV